MTNVPTANAAEYVLARWSTPRSRVPRNPSLVEYDVAVVLVEPRPHRLIGPVVRNVIEGIEMDPRVAAHPLIITSAQGLEFLTSNAVFHAAEDVKGMVLENLAAPNLTAGEYNALFQNRAFWELIPQEHILIIQTDGFLQHPRRSIVDFLKLDVGMIGGLYNYVEMSEKEIEEYKAKNKNVSDDAVLGRISKEFHDIRTQLHASPSMSCAINGGISLRKKSAMIECIDRVTLRDIFDHRALCGMNTLLFRESAAGIGEDVFFHNALDVLRKPLPRVYDCMRFANNLYYPEFLAPEDDPPMFVHGWDKSFFQHAAGCHAAEWECIPL